MAFDSYPTTAYDGSRIPNPARPFSENIKTNSLKFEADSGHQQLRRKGANKRQFELTYPVLTKSQSDTLFDFFLAKTTTIPFLWIHPITKQQYTVVFTNDLLTRENFARGPQGELYKMSMKIEEVL